ncbi:hypothetical protein NEUTE2DRAFT_157053 [Neurospora tetrasperma FGSC 2509]|nr:hypothetical protein NEUTE2DRAFT_157053 [Neurospora tetrasperma FGSC 2509]
MQWKFCFPAAMDWTGFSAARLHLFRSTSSLRVLHLEHGPGKQEGEMWCISSMSTNDWSQGIMGMCILRSKPQPNPRVVSLPFFHLPHTERAAGLLAGFKEEKCRDYRMFGSAMRTVNLPVLIIAQLE